MRRIRPQVTLNKWIDRQIVKNPVLLKDLIGLTVDGLTKKCSVCNKFKSVSDFFRHLKYKYGFHFMCKKCHMKKKSKFFSENPSRLLDRRERGRFHYCPVKNKIYHRRYFKKNKKIILKKANKESWTPRGRAREALRYEVKMGRIIKPHSCQHCLKKLPKRNIHGHHPDYANKLDVMWLCVKCHSNEHLRIRLLNFNKFTTNP